MRFTATFLVIALAGLLTRSTSAHADPLVTEYRGTCDASAAVSLGHDHFIVANDEENSLRVYRLGYPNPVMVYDLDTFAEADPDRPEMDIEAAAKIGSRVYWITSHGTNRKGKYRPGRHRFLATDIGFKDGRPVITPVGSAYTGLLEDMAAAAQLKKYRLEDAAETAPKDEGGFNIEGLAATPSGALLVGFRNPIPGGNALIVTINNPNGVIHGKKPEIGPVLELPLGGLGIRSIERRGDTYLIVAGPYDGNSDFRLYHWRGPGTTPSMPVPAADFGGLNPEALFVASTGPIQILSDDGAHDLGGMECKDLPGAVQRFRGIAIQP